MKKILLVGCGNMGGAMLESWLMAKLIHPDSIIVDPHLDKSSYELSLYSSQDDIPKDFVPDIVIFAIKPQMMAQICPLYKKYNALFISMAAGISTTQILHDIGHDKALIRIMPNTPAMVSAAMSVAYCHNTVTDSHKQDCKILLDACGHSLFIDNEDFMHIVTAISGSGPAYVFYMIESMIDAAINIGLKSDIARKLVIQTILGSATLAQQSDLQMARLRENVTSPNGTTAAALDKLMHDNIFSTIIKDTINAAYHRSMEIEEQS